MISRLGIAATLIVLTVPTVLLVPVAFFVTSRDPQRWSSRLRSRRAARKHQNPSVSAGIDESQGTSVVDLASIKAAFHNRTYLLLIAGFSTCGFHMVIIESHLFNQYVRFGIPGAAAAVAFSVYGIATILGALASGWLSTTVRKSRLLGFYYGFRAVWVIAFLTVMPKNFVFAVIFAVGLDLTGDATVSPTSGLVNRAFHLSQVATLIGILFFCHQIGAFLSAWLGGVLLEATGSYTAIWMIDIVLCVFASIMSLRIREPQVREEID